MPVSQGTGLPARTTDESVIAADDHFEGKLKTSRGVRILGTVDGTVESESHVHIEQSAKVTADVTAEEVVISGQYSGKLVCRQRLEVQPTGRVNGSIETVKFMLHEGGYVDGELHMQKPGQAPSSSADASRPADAASRPIGAMRSTVEPSIRQQPSGGGNGPSESGAATASEPSSSTSGSKSSS